MNPAARSRAELAPSQRRLQREADFTGERLSAFSDVFLRHGLPGAVIGLLCLLNPTMRGLLESALAGLYDQPLQYLAVGVLLLVALNLYAWAIDRRWRPEKLGWVVYLAALSAWEEWVFRLAVPYYVQSRDCELLAAVITVNLAFAVLHYFTLRWKWQWCITAFLFGLALSRQMNLHFDLPLIIAIHWVATFLNTPRLPGGSRVSVTGR